MNEGAVLIVEPDRSLAVAMSAALQEHNYSVEITSDGERALHSIEKAPPGVIISALDPRQLSGVKLLSTVTSRWPSLRFILVIAVEEMSLVAEAIRRAAHTVLSKPPGDAELLDAVRSAIEDANSLRLSSLATAIIGDSSQMIRVREQIAFAAKMGVNILIKGESGTGKELVAREVHRLSSRGGKPLIPINCANMPEDLWEGLFFGHQKGSFTGAHEDRTGVFEQADGSHIFLDELQTLRAENQGRFLRVIEDGNIRPLGSKDVQTVSIRFITATNRDPGLLIREGTLREDLFYRLSGYEILLPPLRDHLEDIPLLACHFLGGTDVRLAEETIQSLQEESWPGNVRQLRNRMEAARGIALALGETTITSAHLKHVKAEALVPSGGRPLEGGFYVRGTLKEISRQVITETLRQVAWNQSEAARRLGIHRKTLGVRLRELGIHRQEKWVGRECNVPPHPCGVSHHVQASGGS